LKTAAAFDVCLVKDLKDNFWMKSQQKEKMTVGERVLAALKMQPVDRIPFVP